VKVELHLHTSRYSGCAVHSPSDVMRRLIACGYEAVYITEHDWPWPEQELAALREKFPQLRIFPGIEVSVGELYSFQHLLVLGTTDVEYVELAKKGLQNAGAVLEKARDEGHLTVLAHPCRWPDAADMIRRGFLPDALEYRTCNQSARQGVKALKLAEAHGLPVVNAGDVHALDMIGCYWIETARDLDGPDDIREIVRAGEYKRCLAEEAD